VHERLCKHSVPGSSHQAARSRAAAREQAENVTTFNSRLEALRMEYMGGMNQPPQQRGYLLERILRELFELFDLDPRASFRLSGEEIDGAFTFDNTDYLLEAKWRRDATAPADVDAFTSKVARKLDNTLGLFIAVNGFTSGVMQTQAAVGRRTTILMDGGDLLAVLEARIALDRLLLRKRRHASHTGEIFLPVGRILSEAE
jgi:hypothetical protein